ncbi:MAG: hypothetical protein CMH61_01105 [Nanoarchaeota archaeon]|nr:hypothetical protein [Nanoarchaeota archaeon]|tara:strand:+ start:393 stop:764 length:372 start_codon:yes stop_codon:yes gene_type:complete
MKKDEFNHIIEQLQQSKYIETIMQFGSSIIKKKYRDVDLCLFTSNKISLKQKLRIVRDVPEFFDINFFDDLPMHLKKEVISTGKILFTRDYYQFLQRARMITDEFPRFKQFLDNYHKERMEAL